MLAEKRAEQGEATLVKPTPRSVAFAATVEGRLFLWGGLTVSYHKDLLEKDVAIEIFDPYQDQWLRVPTSGDHPPCVVDGACAAFGHYLYVYGGCHYYGHCDLGSLHRLDTKTLTWTLLADYTANGPRKKISCQMVACGDKLALFGGYGPPHGGIANECTNELHIFDLREGMINLFAIRSPVTYTCIRFFPTAWSHVRSWGPFSCKAM